MLQANREKAGSGKYRRGGNSRAASRNFRRRKNRARTRSSFVSERRPRNRYSEISGRFLVRRNRQTIENSARNRDESPFLRPPGTTGKTDGKISLMFMKEMNCEDVLIQKMALIDGEKSEFSAEQIDAHVATCENCRREIEQLERTVLLLNRQKRQAPDADLWSAVEKRIGA